MWYLLQSSIIFYLSTFLLIACMPLATCMENQTLAHKMGSDYLKSLQEEVQQETSEEKRTQLNKQLMMTSYALSLFHETGKNELKNQDSTVPFLDAHDYQQLNVFGNRHTLHHHLAKHIPLELGKTKLALALGKRKSIQQLKKQQILLKELIANEKLLTTLGESLARIATIEQTVLTLLSQTTTPFLLDGMLNTFVTLLKGADASQKQGGIRDLTQNKYSLALADFITTCFIDGSALRMCSSTMLYGYENMLKKYGLFAQSVGQLTAPFAPEKIIPFLTQACLIIPWEFTGMLPYPAFILMNLAAAGLTLKRSLFDATHVREQALKIIETFTQLHHELKLLEKLITHHPVLRNILNGSTLNPEAIIAAELEDTKNHQKDPQPLLMKQEIAKQLTQTLKTTPINNQPTYLATRLLKKVNTRFFSAGTLASYHQLIEVKKYFIPGLCMLGEIAMYYGLAKLVKKFQAQNLTFCFPDYEEKATEPHLKTTNLWLPQLLGHADESHLIIPYNIELGKNGKELVALITGVNQGGKTSLLRACATAALMALTLSFTAASSYQLTPPHTILLSFNASDNLGQQALGYKNKGSSGFGSEVTKLDAFVKTMKKLNNDEFALVLIDELFGKANGGSFFSHAIIDQIFMKLPNALTIVSSLFDQPKLLGIPDGICVNYQFSDRDSYHLSQGALIDQTFRLLTLNDILKNPLYKSNLDYLVHVGLLKQELCLQRTPQEEYEEKVAELRTIQAYLTSFRHQQQALGKEVPKVIVAG